MLSDGMLDLLTVWSFIVGLENLDMNISQTDLQNEIAKLDEKVDEKVNLALNQIHAHLEKQDEKLNYLMEVHDNESLR